MVEALNILFFILGIFLLLNCLYLLFFSVAGHLGKYEISAYSQPIS